MASLEEKIRKQVEFYFSDSNLPNDRFLRTLVANHPEGYVNIDTIANFKRMQQLTKDREEVIKALKSSSMLEVDKDNVMVRRITALPEENTQDVRSVYVKGIPADAHLEDLETFFGKFGKVNAVRMRRYKATKDFKGSVFVEFATEQEAKTFVEQQQNLKYKEADTEPLLVKTKNDYSAEKEKRRHEFKQKKKEEALQAQIDSAIQELKYDEGALLHISNIGSEPPVDFKEMKNLLKDFNVAYVDMPYKGDSTQAMIRFTSPESQKKALEHLTTNKIKLGGNEPTLVTPRGEEEKNIYHELVATRVKEDVTKAKDRGGKGGKGKSGRGGKAGRGGKGKKRKNEEGSEQPTKAVKVE
jgi:lupus La protein